MIRLTWTVVATIAYFALAWVSNRTATIFVPVYCFLVVLPYGIAACKRRLEQYRGPGEDGRENLS